MKTSFRKASLTIHLWLGMLSGIIVLVVCLTGAMYVFKEEITDFLEPWRFVEPQNTERILPSRVIDIANGETEKTTPTAVTYGESFDAVSVDYYVRSEGMTTVYLNPYNGHVQKTTVTGKDDFSFFGFILKGHRSLWLPTAIGRPIVGWATVIFVITLITGMVLWIPKRWNKKTLKQNLTIRYKKSFFQFNRMLHNTLGGYALIGLLILSLTGLIWSFKWFNHSVYYLTSGGKELIPYTLHKSEIKQKDNQYDLLDTLHISLLKQEPQAKTFYYALPSSDDGVFRVSVVHERGSYYKTDNLFFDRYTLQPLEGSGPYAGKYTEATKADKLRRMNLEIHSGRIWGLTGKIIACLLSLVGASLPVTGFIIWYKKRYPRRKR